MMRWLIDSDVFIQGEHGDPAFVPWLEAQKEVATADLVRCEFLIGVHALSDTAKRRHGERFYAERIAGMVSLTNEPQDFEAAARMAGEARRQGKGAPSVVDALLAALAIRTGATVATRNQTDFRAMGCPCANPLKPLAT